MKRTIAACAGGLGVALLAASCILVTDLDDYRSAQMSASSASASSTTSTGGGGSGGHGGSGGAGGAGGTGGNACAANAPLTSAFQATVGAGFPTLIEGPAGPVVVGSFVGANNQVGGTTLTGTQGTFLAQVGATPLVQQLSDGTPGENLVFANRIGGKVAVGVGFIGSALGSAATTNQSIMLATWDGAKIDQKKLLAGALTSFRGHGVFPDKNGGLALVGNIYSQGGPEMNVVDQCAFAADAVQKGFVARFSADLHCQQVIFFTASPGMAASYVVAPTSAAVGKNGILYVGGQYGGVVDFGNGVAIASATPSGYATFIAAFDEKNGDKALAATNVGVLSLDKLWSYGVYLASDAEGRVWLTGTDATPPHERIVVERLGDQGPFGTPRFLGSATANVAAVVSTVSCDGPLLVGALDGTATIDGVTLAHEAKGGDPMRAFWLQLDASGKAIDGRAFLGGTSHASGVARSAGRLWIAGDFDVSLELDGQTLDADAAGPHWFVAGRN